MLHTDRLNFIKDNISYWIKYGGSTPIQNGFIYNGCSALFIEDGFRIHFGFYDPDGKKLAEYTFNTETGTALMLYDERYDKDYNECTSILADILGGLIGSDEYFTLINKPVVVCMDPGDKVYTDINDLVEDLMRDIMSPFRPRKVERKNDDVDLFGIVEAE